MAAKQSLRVFVFLALATYISGMEVQCSLQDPFWIVVGEHYTCFATVTSVDNSTSFTSVIANHAQGQNNSDVTAFAVDFNDELTFFPRGIEQFFPNLRVIRWWVGNLTTIDSSTFQPFPDLELVDIGHNKLVSLDGNLFQHSPRLRVIWFNNNLLQNVGQGFLTGLTNLTMANFGENPCINVWAGTPEEIEDFRIQLPIQCPPLDPTPDPPSTTISTTTEPDECPIDCTRRDDVMMDMIVELQRRVDELSSNSTIAHKRSRASSSVVYL